MRIIHRGEVVAEVWPKQVTCPECRSILEIEAADLHHGHYTSSYDSYGDTITPGVYVHCAVCPGDENGPQQVRVTDVLDATIREAGERQA